MDQFKEIVEIAQTAPDIAVVILVIFAIYKIFPEIKSYLSERDKRQIELENKNLARDHEFVALGNRMADVVEANTKAFNDMKNTNSVTSDKLDEVKKLVIETRDGVNGVQTELAFLSRDFHSHVQQKKG